MISITLATQNDAPVLAGIMKSAWCAGFRGILSDAIITQYTKPDTCTAMFSQILASGEGTMYLARKNGVPTGLLYLLSEGDSLHIEALLTVPEVWGHGVGAALMETALADGVRAQKEFIRVWPFAKNARARKFYEKWGFTPTGAHRSSDALEVEYIRKLH